MQSRWRCQLEIRFFARQCKKFTQPGIRKLCWMSNIFRRQRLHLTADIRPGGANCLSTNCLIFKGLRPHLPQMFGIVGRTTCGVWCVHANPIGRSVCKQTIPRPEVSRPTSCLARISWWRTSWGVLIPTSKMRKTLSTVWCVSNVGRNTDFNL